MLVDGDADTDTEVERDDGTVEDRNTYTYDAAGLLATETLVTTLDRPNWKDTLSYELGVLVRDVHLGLFLITRG